MSATDSDDPFTALLEQHLPIVRKVAGAYGADASDRQDLMQEIAMQLWKAWPRYDRTRPFATWMYRIALNVGISSLRTRMRRSGSMRSLQDLAVEPAAEDARRPELDEHLEQLRRVIDRLGALDRALLILYLDDRPQREIGEVLGLTETNVATKIARLKQRVRERLEVIERETT